MPRVEAAEPAGCGYWRRAASGEVFFTVADDHKRCPVGAHTHNVPLSPAEQDELMGLVQTMVDLSYLKMEEVPTHPDPQDAAAGRGLRAAGGRAGAAGRGARARQRPAADAARRGGAGRRRRRRTGRRWDGRPARSFRQRSTRQRTAASFGCVGNRVYTGAGENDAYFAIPGSQLEAVEAQLATIVSANQALEAFHRARLGS